MKYIIFSATGEGIAIAKKLQNEGKEVVFAMAQSMKNCATDAELKNFKPEKEEEKKRRLLNGEGIVTKMSAEVVFKKLMKGLKNPEEYFLFFDLNSLFRFSEPLADKGYYGNFITAEDREFETNRQAAKDFCQKYYLDIEIAEVNEFSTIDEAKRFLEDEETENIWVIKGKGDGGETVCPNTDEYDIAKQQILDALDKNKKDYENTGFILEKKIVNPIELTPQAVFYDGKLIFTDIDLENKPLGAGNLAGQTGCAMGVVIPTVLQARINKIAFPPIVYEMAEKRKGIFVWDISILIDPVTGIMYMGEFCSNRFGWDSIFAEIELAGSADKFFSDIINNKDPHRYTKDKVGTTVRLFNLPDKPAYLGGDEKDEKMNIKNWDGVWLMNTYKKDEEYLHTGFSTDCGVCSGIGYNLEEAVKNNYDAVKNFGMEGVYYRPDFDFLSKKYPTSILNRYNYIKNLLEPVNNEINEE